MNGGFVIFSLMIHNCFVTYQDAGLGGRGAPQGIFTACTTKYMYFSFFA